MKKTIALIICGLLIGAAGAWAVITLIIPQWNKSAVDNTYWQVAAKLDKGGEVFGYLHTEKMVEAFQRFLANLEKNLASTTMGGKPETAQAFAMLNLFFKGYGLEEISGLGLSSITLKPGLHRNRIVIHHRPGRNQGLIWNVTGEAPRYLDEIDLLAADTALAFVSDYNIEKLLAWFGQQGQKMPGQQMGQGMDMMKAGLKAAGIDGDRLFKSYGGRLGFVITLDPEKRVNLPLPGSAISIPEPGMALLIKVNDTYLFDLIKDKLAASLQGVVKDEAGVKKIVFPKLPMPFPVEPVIAQKDGWLLAASMPALPQGIFGSRTTRLADSKEFAAIAYKLPRRGNGFGYISPLVPRLVAQILRENKSVFPASAALEKIAAILARSQGFCDVWENSNEGLIYTINHGFEVSTLFEFIEAIVEIAREKSTADSAAAAAASLGAAAQAETK